MMLVYAACLFACLTVCTCPQRRYWVPGLNTGVVVITSITKYCQALNADTETGSAEMGSSLRVNYETGTKLLRLREENF